MHGIGVLCCVAWGVSVYARGAYIVLTRVGAPGRSASARSWACGGSSGRRRCSPAPHRAAGDRRLESRVDAYGTLLTGARGGTSPGCIIPQLAGQSGRLQCLAHMGMYSIIYQYKESKRGYLINQPEFGRAGEHSYKRVHPHAGPQTGRARESGSTVFYSPPSLITSVPAFGIGGSKFGCVTRRGTERVSSAPLLIA